MDDRSIAPLISGVFIGIVFLLLMQGVIRSKHLGDCEKRSKQLCAEVVVPITVYLLPSTDKQEEQND